MTLPCNLLVLDIDETLVSTVMFATHPCDFYLTFGTNPVGADAYGVTKRPGVDAFLRWCFASSVFRTAVWTAGTADYGAAVMAELLEPGEELEFLWGRDRCSLALHRPDEEDDDPDRWHLVKDLKKLRKRYDLHRVLHLDNTPSVACRNYGNLVPIPSFYAQAKAQTDDCFERLQPRLLEWFAAPTVRTIDKRGWWI